MGKKSDEMLEKSLLELEELTDEVLNKSKAKAQEDEEDLDEKDIVDKDLDEEEDEEDEEDEEEEEDDEEEEDEEEDSKKSLDYDPDLVKSIRETFDKGEISKAVEVSDFLAAITEACTDSMALMAEEICKSRQTDNSEMLEKSFVTIANAQKAIIDSQRGITRIVKSLQDGLVELADRMESLETQPSVRKSVSNVKVHNKDFKKSLGVTSDLSKGQVLGALNDMMAKGDPMVSAMDIIGYESGAPLRAELVPKVQEYCNQ